MKWLLITLFSFSAYSAPMMGEYKYCYSYEGTEEAYLNIVHFEDRHIGVQMYYQNFPISFQLILDGQERVSSEGISGMTFEYRAAYARNMMKVVFKNPAKAEAMGLNPKFMIKFQGALASFVFNGVKLHCRKRI